MVLGTLSQKSTFGSSPPHNENSLILVVINFRSMGLKITTVYMRILTNYFQTLTLTQDCNLSWQSNLSEFLYVISFLSKEDQLINSQDLFIHETVKHLHPFFVKMAITLFSLHQDPRHRSLARLFRKTLDYKNYMVQSIIVFVFVCLPPITALP